MHMLLKKKEISRSDLYTDFKFTVRWGLSQYFAYTSTLEDPRKP